MSNLLIFRPRARKLSREDRRNEIYVSSARGEAPQEICHVFHARVKARIDDAILLLRQSHSQIRENIARIADLSVKFRLEADLKSVEQQLELAKSEAARL